MEVSAATLRGGKASMKSLRRAEVEVLIDKARRSQVFTP